MFFRANGVGVDRRRRKLRVSEPALHKILLFAKMEAFPRVVNE